MGGSMKNPMQWLSCLIVVAGFGWAQTPPAKAPAEPAREPGLYAIFNTSMGAITAKLFEKETPLTVKNFVALARGTRLVIP